MACIRPETREKEAKALDAWVSGNTEPRAIASKPRSFTAREFPLPSQSLI
jgi:hypothetical protein